MSIKIRGQQDPQQSSNSTNPQNTKLNVAKIAEKIDIVSLILDYGIDLIQQINGEYICVCPFHNDINPSMRVYPTTNSFYCYGCQAGASVFEFVMRMENIEFKDALLRLAEKAGYSATFVLRDIELPHIDESFSTHREKIEKNIHIAAREIWKTVDKSVKAQVFSKFEELWRWYDKQQQIFDRCVFNGKNFEKLIVKLYEFHRIFLQKLNTFLL